MPGTAPAALIARTTRAKASAWVSFHRPAQPGVIRPFGETAVDSAITSPEPPRARPERWTWCHSLTTPSLAEYWHIGDTAIRFLRVTPLRENGWNKDVIVASFSNQPQGWLVIMFYYKIATRLAESSFD